MWWIRKGPACESCRRVEQKAGSHVCRAPEAGSGQGPERSGVRTSGSAGPGQSCDRGTPLWDTLLSRMGWRNRAGTVGNR